MSSSAEFEARLDKAVADAAAARHLAVAGDRDLADLTVKVDALRKALNGLGLQTAARFEQVDRRFEQVDRRFEQVDRRFERLENKVDDGFAEMRFRFDQTAAGMAAIVDLLTPRDDG